MGKQPRICILHWCDVKRVLVEVDGERHELVIGPGDEWSCDVALGLLSHEDLEYVHRTVVAALRRLRWG